jgi:hypothetical protein
MALSDLVEALNIFLKYGDPAYPTHCEHDELNVCVAPSLVSAEDRGRLEELGFIPGEEGFKSFRYGSA